MSKMLIKNILRDIRRTKARFISIMLIIMLGVGFLVGINSTAPSMYAVVDDYYKDTNLMDFRLISTVGFSEDDVKAIENMEGVEDVMPSYFCDVLTKGDTGSVIRLFATPEAYGDSKEINSLTVREGRLPEKADEIVIGASRFADYNLGDTISFFSPVEGESLEDSLLNTDFTIVGIVDSPMYISFERGFTNVGSGKVAAYMLIPPENFLIERYTDLYVTFTSLRDFTPYSEEYKQTRDEILERLKDTAASREQAFNEEFIDTAQASIDEARITLEEEKSKAEAELSKAQQTIDDGWSVLKTETASAQNTLALVKEQIENGKKELFAAQEEFYEAIALALKETDTAKKQITESEKLISNAKAQIKENLFAQVSSLGISREQFDNLYGDRDMLSVEDVENLCLYAQAHRISASSQLADAEESLSALKLSLGQEGINPETDPQYLAAKAQRDSLKVTVEIIDGFLESGKEQLISSIETINQQQSQLENAKVQLEAASTQLSQQTEQAKTEFAATRKQLNEAQRDYDTGVSALETTKSQTVERLKRAQEELEVQKAEVQEELAKAEAELLNAQEELDALSEPQWMCNTRDNNPGYSTYTDNVERVTAVGKVFPVFFLLVAVLVCVTTMSRLIEEQRGDIGALTTLGYKKRAIIFKYIIYSVSATVIGAAIGIALGVVSIPYVIFNAYRMLYSSLPSLTLTLSTGSAVVATLVAIICTSTVAFVTCNSLLRKEPATLLRPKAPKPGKRIFLERVKFIWNHLGFFSKVTVRNIFRYKARFFMTVIGIAGCTALIVAALGLYGSINDVVDKQFGEVFSYDAVVALEENADTSTVKAKLQSDERIESTLMCRQTLATVHTSKISFTDDTYICVPENTQEINKVINLHNRKTSEKYEISNNGVILTEKLAKSLNVSVGDKVSIIDKGIKVRGFTVEGICENYLYGYVYMSPELYEKSYGCEPEYNAVICKKSAGAQFDSRSAGEDYLETQGVLGITFVEDSVDSFNEMIGSLNYVVLVMLICAGALAFVVLYNLTNINIAERKREISTLKVLGFKNTETSAYIYRENLLLSLLGTVIGLLLGVWLLGFIIKTVEIDMLMFGREIHLAVYLISALLTLVFAAIVNIIMHFRIKKIDMVESLKSVE